MLSHVYTVGINQYKASIDMQEAVMAKKINWGRTRIRTGVVRIKTESDNHYTIQPIVSFNKAGNTLTGSDLLNWSQHLNQAGYLTL